MTFTQDIEPRWAPGMRGTGAGYRTGGLSGIGARFLNATADRKLAPVRLEPHKGKPRPVPAGPFCSATYVSIAKSCPSSCRFRDGACYVTAGFTAPLSRALDDSAHRSTGDQVIDAESALLEGAFRRAQVPQDGARGGRDLRLHIGGDVPSETALQRLAWAVDTWLYRGGGAVWTFTHRWRELRRSVWGRISVLASVETVAEANAARRLGYVPAIVVLRFPSRRAFRLEAMRDQVVPCPAETSGGRVTCVECRMCLDADALRRRGKAIGFAVHGIGAAKVRLPVMTEAM